MAANRIGKASAAEKLARSLAAAAAGEPSPAEPAAGMEAAAFREHFARALEVLRGGGDPRRVAELPGPFQEAFLALWEERAEADPVLDLARLTRDNAVQKAVRRSLHRMRSAGMDLPEVSGPRPSVLARAAAPAETPLPCFMTEPSSQGVESLLIARYVQGGVASAQVFVDDENGLLEFDGGVVGRNRHREMLRAMQEDDGVRWLPISYEEARQRLAEGARRSREKQRPLPEKYLELSSQFPEVAPVPIPQGRERFPREALAGVALSETEALLDRGEFVRWGPPRAFLEVMIQKLEEIRESRVIISQEQRIQQVRALLEGAAQRMLEAPEERKRFQERLFRMAVFLERSGDGNAARLAAAAAWPLTDPDFAPEGHPFFRRLARKGFLSPEEIVAQMGEAAGEDKDPEAEDPGAPPATPGGRIVLP